MTAARPPRSADGAPRDRGDRVIGYVIGAVLAAAFFLLGLAAGGCS